MVCHRLQYIRRFDMVAVMEGGSVVELDRPEVLLARDSRLAHLHAKFDES